MEDREIIALYMQRSEAAIVETEQKYGVYCTSIAQNILQNQQDSEECVSDTWLRTWNAIPPQTPNSLKLFVGRIVRNLSLDCYRAARVEKRGGGQVVLALSELAECVSSGATPETALEDQMLAEAISVFLWSQPKESRKMFVLRYWYLESVGEIALSLGYGQSKVKSSLHRTRKKLRQYLEQEGIAL